MVEQIETVVEEIEKEEIVLDLLSPRVINSNQSMSFTQKYPLNLLKEVLVTHWGML